MNAPDLFALGGRQDDDVEILALFRQWCAAWRACSCSSKFANQDEFDAACDVATRLAERIYDAPVQGVVGLAIKAFMVGEGQRSDTLEDRQPDPCALGPFTESSYACRAVRGEYDTWTDVAHLYLPSHALRGLLASAAAFVPELRPLVQGATESPLTLPLDDTAEEGSATYH
jgi:hypothetical protein